MTVVQSPPPTPPPPPVKRRAPGMVRPPVTRRRVPALPPPPADCVEDDDEGGRDDDWVELDPVLQNEQNDVIWQRRVDCAAAADTLSGTTNTSTAALLSPDSVRTNVI